MTFFFVVYFIFVMWLTMVQACSLPVSKKPANAHQLPTQV